MQTEYKHIYFDQVDNGKRKTELWYCWSKSGGIIGDVKWYPAWRQYCWFQDKDVIMAKSCLEDVAHFIGQLMDARKKLK